MKVISIKQPWASLIVTPRANDLTLGIKDIENRTWATKFRGRVLIHASLSFDKTAVDKISCFDAEQAHKVWFDLNDNKFPIGSIIGSVEIVDCVINHPSIWAEKTRGTVSKAFKDPRLYCEDWINDVNGDIVYKKDVIYNWVVADPILFDKPIPCKGKLGLWEYDFKQLTAE